MTELWWVGAVFVIVHLGLGGFTAPGIAGKIERGRRRSRRPGGERLASFLTTTVMGRVTVVLFWPVFTWLAHRGFLFGLWGWKGETSSSDRR